MIAAKRKETRRSLNSQSDSALESLLGMKKKRRIIDGIEEEGEEGIGRRYVCVRWSRSRVRSIPVYRDKRWRGRRGGVEGGRREGKKRGVRVCETLYRLRGSLIISVDGRKRERERERRKKWFGQSRCLGHAAFALRRHLPAVSRARFSARPDTFRSGDARINSDRFTWRYRGIWRGKWSLKSSLASLGSWSRDNAAAPNVENSGVGGVGARANF